MKVKIIHFYPDLMNLYGSYGNLAVLKKQLEKAGCEVEIAAADYGDRPDTASADFIFIGAGTERSQKAALADFMRLKNDIIMAAESGCPMLLCGTAMELAGTEIMAADGEKFQALGLCGFKTEQVSRRIVGDVYAVSSLCSDPVVGFMNKSGIVSGVERPFIDSASLGFGNSAEHGPEGFIYKNVLGSQLTGPLLVKNPGLLNWVIGTIFERRGVELPQQAIDDPLAKAAYLVTAGELAKLLK